ncbi:MAG: AIR synthase-related protein, partial [Gammaproteobacteria bacterium]
ANLKNWVSPSDLDACVEHLRALNREPAVVAADFDVHASTDVTGFGLACHALEMAHASNVTLTIEVDDIPLMGGTLDMYRKGMTTGSNASNREMAGDDIRIDRDLPAWHESVLFDPQTNGGLLFALPAEQSGKLVESLHAHGQPGHVIGAVASRDPATFIRFV